MITRELLEGTSRPAKVFPEYNALEVKDAIQTLNTHCKDAMWMLEKNRPLWRGFSTNLKRLPLSTKFFVSDPSLTVRGSRNTSNHYTMLFDTNPANSEYPKRSKSFICTTSESYAREFDMNGLFAVIPFDGVKIGEVRRGDMWDVTVSPFRLDITDLNRFYSEKKISSASIDSFREYQDTYLDMSPEQKNREQIDFNRFVYGKNSPTLEQTDDILSNLVKFVTEFYTAEKLGFVLSTTKTLSERPRNQEVWAGGKCVLIRYKMWEDLEEAYRTNQKGSS